jgi:hypothetical protein
MQKVVNTEEFDDQNHDLLLFEQFLKSYHFTVVHFSIK